MTVCLDTVYSTRHCITCKDYTGISDTLCTSRPLFANHSLSCYSSAVIFLCPVVSCPSKQCLWSIPPMLIAVAPLMMRQQTRPVRNISSARSLQTRSHLSLYSLGGSRDLTLLWPRGRENGSSIWFRETLASAVIYKQNNTSFFPSPFAGKFMMCSDVKLSHVWGRCGQTFRELHITLHHTNIPRKALWSHRGYKGLVQHCSQSSKKKKWGRKTK